MTKAITNLALVWQWAEQRAGESDNFLSPRERYLSLPRYARPILAECVAGNICGACYGAGRKRGYQCSTCNGSGRVDMKHSAKIHPAFIRSTNRTTKVFDEPWFFAIVDECVKGASIRERCAFLTRFILLPRRRDSTRRRRTLNAWLIRAGERPMPRAEYGRCVADLLARIDQAIEENRAKNRGYA